ncbi:stonustoxin subunit alpha-like [Carassius auratus]|uniref:Stonustoxin subunit alpha-like n=1 Tax=Carassius auratus TaxID=7957 RepID=A0A6P6MAE1_CARAU|nr:stonustoxin subunit alpha-like [Carassius auratus]
MYLERIYCRFLTLDLNTVNKGILLSERNRAALSTETVQSYPDHPDRFDCVWQVLCRESVCGRCYWETEWSAGVGVNISVSYKSISRKGRGDECWFGCNDQSWSLFCSPDSYSLWHNKIQTALAVESIIRKTGVSDDDDDDDVRRIGVSDDDDDDDVRRIGVFVDHSAGTLSFYSVSDTMSLIHTVQTTFTQPLYPGFGVYKGSSVKLCDLTAEMDT